MKKAKACFADGGQISKADQMIAEMERKYGVSGNSQPAPHPVAQPAPQPAPQQGQGDGRAAGAPARLTARAISPTTDSAGVTS